MIYPAQLLGGFWYCKRLFIPLIVPLSCLKRAVSSRRSKAQIIKDKRDSGTVSAFFSHLQYRYLAYSKILEIFWISRMNALQTLIKSTHAFGKARIVRYKPLSVQHSRIGLSSGEANQQVES